MTGTQTSDQDAPGDTPIPVVSPPEEWAGVVHLGRRADFVRRYRHAFTLGVVVVSVVTCLLLGAFAGSPAISTALRHLRWAYIPMMLVAHVVAYAGYLVAHHQVVNRSRSIPISWRRGAQIALIGFGGWLINGGFNVDRHALEAAGASRGHANRSAIALGLLELMLLAPAAWFCALLLLGIHHVSESVTVPWVILVPIGFIVVLTSALRDPRKSRARETGIIKVLDYLAGGTRATIKLLRRPRQGLLVIAGIALYWGADIGALWAALQFVSTHVGTERLVLAYATGYILTRRTLPFAGVVVIEVLMTLSLVSLGVPLAASAIAVLVYRLSDFLLTLGGALVASSALERSMTFLDAESSAERTSLEVQPGTSAG